MKVGVVAEGPSDVAVLLNILHGKLGVERKDIVPIRPELTTDETDLSAKRKGGGYKAPSKKSFSNWQIVLEECQSRTSLIDFLDSPIDEPRLLVVQIDSAEAHLGGFDIERPEQGSEGYVEEMRARVVAKISSLLGDDLTRQTRFAVAVEEIDAWILTLYTTNDDADTGLVKNPKKKLEFLLTSPKAAREKPRSPSPRKAPKSEERPTKRSQFNLYDELSAPLREADTLATSAARNKSLHLFVDSLANP